MLTLRLTNYLYGTVRVRISGAIPERFINLCLARGIFLWGITKHNDDVFASLRLGDFFRIRPLARRSHSRIEVMGHAGFPFTLKRVMRRKMLVVGAVLFFVLLNLLTARIWFVDVSGQKEVPSGRITAIAAAYGLKPGAFKGGLDLAAVEKEMLLAVPELAWVGVNVAGTRALIEVVEKTVPKVGDRSPAHVVAAKDGVITEVIVIAGQAAVKKGDTVKRGDLLIKGFVDAPPPPGPGQVPIITLPTQFVRAGGIVKARVWYESYGEAGLTLEVYRRTGRQAVAVTLRIGGRELALKKAPPQPFPRFEAETVHKKLPGGRNSDLTVESTINIFHELVAETNDISAEQARDLARGKALAAVQDRIPEGAQVLVREVAALPPAEPRLVRVKVTVETIEDIGKTMNIDKQ
ncbi:MAG TPA: sporulation protein YqfD [Negativicutes bacterium]|nr:sporulation protein YqfD [Negativicutes bacterium]